MVGLLFAGRLSLSSGTFSFWDDVRSSATTEIIDSSENVYLVSTPADTESSIVRMADFKLFLPFSVDGEELRPGVWDDSFTALLAQHQWNTQGYLGENDCNLRLTMEFIDSQFSPIATTKAFTNMQQRNTSLAQPAATALVGAYRSAVTAPLALLAGLNGLPQVSYASTSSDFDVKNQFPTFGRTVTNSAGEAAVALRFLSQQVGSTQVAVLYMTDSFGSALQKAFAEAAADFGIKASSFPLPAQVDETSAMSTMRQLREAGYRHIYAIAYEPQMPIILEAAASFGLLTEDYFWMIPGLDLEVFRQTRYSATVYEGLDGAAIVTMQASVTADTLYVGQEVSADESLTHLEETPAHAAFRQLWKEKLVDTEFRNYVQSKLPSSLVGLAGSNQVSFSAEPIAFRPFLYDAVMSLAVAMCRTGNSTHLFLGEEVFDQFRILDEEGVSGRLRMDESTGTRDYETIRYVVWNLHATEDEERPLAIVPALHYREGSWQTVANNQFLYRGGNTEAPTALPPVEMDLNMITSSTRVLGFVLMGIVAASCIIGLAWILRYWDEHVVRSAYRGFLLQICCGTLCMALTAIPLSQDESTVDDPHNLDLACQISPWLYVMGISLVLGALLTKILAIRHAALQPDAEVVQVGWKGLLTTTAVLMGANATILMTWTLFDPLEWTRIEKSTSDRFDRPTESYASCESEHDTVFTIVICVLNACVVLVAIIVVLQSSAIELEFQESRYLGFSAAAFFQAWCMGAPIVVVVLENPEGRFLVQMGIVFVTAQAVLSLTFLPRALTSHQVDRK